MQTLMMVVITMAVIGFYFAQHDTFLRSMFGVIIGLSLGYFVTIWGPPLCRLVFTPASGLPILGALPLGAPLAGLLPRT
jgi:hypothetical protein